MNWTRIGLSRYLAALGLAALACSTSFAQDQKDELFQAARKGDAAAVSTLIEAGADVNARDRDGLTPLMSASKHGHDDVLRTLLESGAKVNERDKSGRTALMHAARDGNLTTARALLDAGAKTNSRAENGWRALEFAEGSSLNVLNLLLETDGQLTPKKTESDLGDTNADRDAEPVPLHQPRNPPYPSRAREEKISGEVVVQIKVLTDGTTEVVRVLKTLPYCTEAAIENARQWRWTPAEKDGRPVDALGIVTVRFDIFGKR